MAIGRSSWVEGSKHLGDGGLSNARRAWERGLPARIARISKRAGSPRSQECGNWIGLTTRVARTKLKEQSRNVYENKGQGQKVWAVSHQPSGSVARRRVLIAES